MSRKSTAISRYNTAVNQQSGKIGNVRYYQKGEKTYVRAAYNSSNRNPRTSGQMLTRLLMVAKVLIWACLKPYLQQAFKGVTASVSSFNRFVSVNAANGVYLPKGLRSQILYPYQVSEGNLPYVDCQVSEGSNTTSFISDILLGASASVATFGGISSAILSNDNNNIFKKGDKITFLLLEQINSSLRPSMVKTKAIQFVIDPDDDTAQSDFSLSSNNTLALSQSTTTKMLAGVFIHSRLTDDGFDVSSQNLVLSSACDYETYLTDAKFEAAASSYGERTEIYLRP